MPYYSFKVKSSMELIIPSRSLSIGEGVDVFAKVIDDLPKFLAELKELEVEVIEYHQLDKLEAIQPDLTMLAESPEVPVLVSVGEQYPPKAEG